MRFRLQQTQHVQRGSKVCKGWSHQIATTTRRIETTWGPESKKGRSHDVVLRLDRNNHGRDQMLYGGKIKMPVDVMHDRKDQGRHGFNTAVLETTSLGLISLRDVLDD